MSRITTVRCGLLLAALGLSAVETGAAEGRGGGFLATPGRAVVSTQFPRALPAGSRYGAIRQQARLRGDHGLHDRRGRGRALFTSFGYPWGWPAGAMPASSPSVEIETSPRWIDRNSFENMPVRAGIVREPTPEPTTYRLEGRPDRPVTRVIRIAGADSQQGKRSRFAHAETGALLLVVPGR
ncbi:hypothetical protein ASE63_08345 [Bosea sp. Root381]|uniref:hypothetical protein n=1 Tax=Bosea sp. Root381 TaxID=1736524 RepID=UPI0006F30CF0|nr:hypothetical protein [Bosea sp. Root381]KRE00099.1 hypothetical protein ASE63_08345 [Bosea sp. Root381]